MTVSMSSGICTSIFVILLLLAGAVADERAIASSEDEHTGMAQSARQQPHLRAGRMLKDITGNQLWSALSSAFQNPSGTPTTTSPTTPSTTSSSSATATSYATSSSSSSASASSTASTGATGFFSGNNVVPGSPTPTTTLIMMSASPPPPAFTENWVGG